MMARLFDRIDLSAVGAERLRPLEALMTPEWPQVWRDFATSHYLTLLSAPGANKVPMPQLASLAVELARGIAQDLSGTQPYIPSGERLHVNARTQRVMTLLEQGQGYHEVAKATGLTASRIRKIETKQRRQQVAARQGCLLLD
ncbi:MAG: hypothetical protein K2Y10_00360 [Burkholderiaceae bacterium]|nr:hypothetical protein [Burkholderiaceae bacterium]MBY0454745.1 hypothetical protein [Burkholderiaceae bacterium]